MEKNSILFGNELRDAFWPKKFSGGRLPEKSLTCGFCFILKNAEWTPSGLDVQDFA